MSQLPDAPILLPGRFDPGFTRVFGWWVRRMCRADFFAVRLARENSTLLADLAAHPGPVIGVSNHCSWWDPLVFTILHRRFMPDRGSTGPIEAEQWRRFGFMKKLGLFGIDPHDPRSAELMVDHVLERFRENPCTNFWITPQGQFVDPRERIVIRPGVSMVAAAASAAGMQPRSASIAIEYVFWVDRRPELLIRLQEVRPYKQPDRENGLDSETADHSHGHSGTATQRNHSEIRATDSGDKYTSTPAWHRAFTRTMRENQAALLKLSIARDAMAFETLIGGEEGRVNPVYDLWQRLHGRAGGIKARQFPSEPRPQGRGVS